MMPVYCFRKRGCGTFNNLPALARSSLLARVGRLIISTGIVSASILFVATSDILQVSATEVVA
jgi:hypothetical protein